MVEAADSEDAAGPDQTSSADPLRVLLVDVSDRGGIARYTDCLRRALESEGAAVALAAPGPRADGGLALAHHRWGPEVSGLARLALRGRRLAEIGPSALLLGRAVVRSRCDVVHMQTEVVPPFDHVAVRTVARRAPVVITAHDPEPLEGGERALERQARRWRAADAVIIHGEGPRRLVERCAPGVPVHVVPVDLPLGGPAVSRDEARRRLGLDGAPTALLLGLIRPYKGIDLLADAWPSVRARVPNARLLLVGEPYGCAGLDRLERSAGVEMRPGFVPEEDFDCWAAVPDVLVLPYDRGSHSGILHRAVTAGTPVLASPSLADEVHRTGAGLVVPLDAAAWADALVAALTGAPPPPPPVALTGRRTALATLAVYRSVVTRRAHGGPGPAVRRRSRPHQSATGGAEGPVARGRPRVEERLRVVEVSNSRQAWGAELAIMALAVPLAHRGIDLVLASPPGGDLSDRWQKLGLRHIPLDLPARRGIRAVDGDSGPTAGQLTAELMATMRSVRAIAPVARGADIVVSSSLWTHFDCALAGRLARRPVVLDLHDIVRPGTGRRVLTAAVRLSSSAIAISPVVADCVGPSGAGRLLIMVPAVELDRFRPGPPDPEVRRRLTSVVTDPLVGMVGRIDPEKGVDLVVRAVSALEGPAARTHLVVIGSPGFDSGAYLESLKAEAGLLLGDRARFVGRIDDVPETLRALDVVVNASVAEPFGLSVLEAQATGIPVVATRPGGITDFLTDGDDALLVAAGDVGALSGALERVLTDGDLATRLARRGRALAEAGHGVDAFADDLADLYRGLVGGQPAGVARGSDR